MQISCPYLVGRQSEIATLRNRLSAAASRRGGGTVFVAGEPGVGKSRLARELVDIARAEGIQTLVGRAVPASGQVAYRPIAEALAQGMRDRGRPDDPDLTPWLPALRVVLPAIGGGEDHPSTGVTATPHECGEALLRVLRWLRGSRPLLLVLEDLGWADPDTVAVVEYLADNLADEPVLAFCTVRPEPATAAAAMVRRVCQRGSATLVELGRLDGSAVAEMVRACVPDASDGLVARVLATADGVPLMVEELLATPGVPATVDEAVRERVAALPADDASVLFAAAVLGRDFDWELLPLITGLPTEAVISALERMVAELLISVEGDGFRFRHALTREAVLALLVPPRRRAVSQAALAALDSARPGHDHADVALQAGDRTRAAAMLAASGEASLRRGALATATATLRHAAELSGDPAMRARVRGLLVEALALAGHLDEALAVGRDLLEQLGTGATATAEVHLHLVRAAVSATRWATALTHLDAAKGVLAARPNRRLSAQADALEAEIALASGEVGRTQQAASAALAAAEALGVPEIACHALELIGRSHRVHDLDAARAAFARAHDVAEAAELPVWRLRALHELGTVDLLDHAGTERLESARSIAERLGAHSVAAVLDVQLAAGYFTRFDLAAGHACARRGVALARRLGLVRLHAMALYFDANVSALRGDRAETSALTAEVLRVVPDDPELEGLVLGLHGMVELVWGERDAARRAIDRGIVRLSTVAVGAPAPHWGLWALLHAVGQLPDAAQCVARVREHGATASRVNRGYLSYAEAVLGGSAEPVASGDGDLAFTPFLHHLGRVLVAEAALAAGWGEPRQWLNEARNWFTAARLDHLAKRCSRLVGTERTWTPTGVTEREQQVLQLVAAGLANKQIAARLHLSVRTVEKHVESLLRKSGARSRTHLVAMVGENT